MVTARAESSPADRAMGFDAGIAYELYLDCVHCGLCTSACPTYLELGTEMDSPRGRIHLMRAATDGRVELSGALRRHLELCLDCRSCETACPSGVQYRRLIEPFRLALEQAGGDGGLAALDWFTRRLLLDLFPYRQRLRWAVAPARLTQVMGLDRVVGRLLPGRLGHMQELVPRFRFFRRRLPDHLPAGGPQRRARLALFTGCVGDAIFRDTNWATARVLQANGCELIVPRRQVCCGAIHYHLGQPAPTWRMMAQNLAAFNLDDVDAIVVNVAGCAAMLKDYGHLATQWSAVDGDGRGSAASGQGRVDVRAAERFAAKVRDVCEFLVELGPVPPPGPVPVRATYHDACHLLHAQKIGQQPRQLLQSIPELELVPLAESDICCGAAGTYNLTQPDMATRLAERKRARIAATGAQAVFAANAGCLLQIGRVLRRAGMALWLAHPIEALDLSYRRLPPPLSPSSAS